MRPRRALPGTGRGNHGADLRAGRSSGPTRRGARLGRPLLVVGSDIQSRIEGAPARERSQSTAARPSSWSVGALEPGSALGSGIRPVEAARTPCSVGWGTGFHSESTGISHYRSTGRQDDDWRRSPGRAGVRRSCHGKTRPDGAGESGAGPCSRASAVPRLSPCGRHRPAGRHPVLGHPGARGQRRDDHDHGRLRGRSPLLAMCRRAVALTPAVTPRRSTTERRRWGCTGPKRRNIRWMVRGAPDRGCGVWSVTRDP